MSEEPSDAKKPRTMTPMAPDNEWPEAWLVCDNIKDQCRDNRCEPNVPVSPEELRKIGIEYWKMDADSYEYPVKAIPWDPQDAQDPHLKALRDERGYSYADIITIHPDHLPDFEKKIAMFFEEHIHDAEEIRYIVGGSGYFDVRDRKWSLQWPLIHTMKPHVSCH